MLFCIIVFILKKLINEMENARMKCVARWMHRARNWPVIVHMADPFSTPKERLHITCLLAKCPRVAAKLKKKSPYLK
jgi:hypothetical protein